MWMVFRVKDSAILDVRKMKWKPKQTLGAADFFGGASNSHVSWGIFVCILRRSFYADFLGIRGLETLFPLKCPTHGH